MSFMDKYLGTIVGLIFTVVALVMGVIFLLTDSGEKKFKREKEENCTEQVTATIVEVKEKYDIDDKRGRYAPIYGFEYKDKEYAVESRICARPLPEGYEEGNKVEICINPEDPEDFYDPEFEAYFESSSFGVIGKVLIVIGAVIGIGTILATVVYIRKRRVV